MTNEIPRRKLNRKSLNKKAAEGREVSSEGLSFGDYSPRYQEDYDIYEKAKNHAREQKKKSGKKFEKR